MRLSGKESLRRSDDERELPTISHSITWFKGKNTSIRVHFSYILSISKTTIAFANLSITGNAEQVEKGGVPSDTPHLVDDK